jgi:transcriptional regulator with XRE-family HTH domain
MSNSNLFENANQGFGSPSIMTDPKVIGANIARLRENADLSQAQLAKAIGVKSQNTIAAIELGKTRKSKHLPDISRVLKVSMTDIDPAYVGEETLITSGFQSSEVEDLKVYASVECGDGAIVLSNEPIKMSGRPRSLHGVRGSYGVLVVGESMAPRVLAGHTVFINPHIPPRIGDLCLFYVEKDGEFRATLKEYLGQNDSSWLVKRYRPKERKFSLAKKDWPRCNVVVGVDFTR